MNQILFSGEIQEISFNDEKSLKQNKQESNTIVENVIKNNATKFEEEIASNNSTTFEEEIASNNAITFEEETIKNNIVLIDEKTIQDKIAEINNEIIIAEDLVQQEGTTKTEIINNGRTDIKKNNKELITNEVGTIKETTEPNEIPITIKPTDKTLFESNIDIINKELKNINITIPIDKLIKEKKRQDEIKKRSKNTIFAKTLLEREKSGNYNIKLKKNQECIKVH